jgi:hypothetical protein
MRLRFLKKSDLQLLDGTVYTAKPTEVSTVRYNASISQYIYILSNVKERFNHTVITNF